MRFYAYRCKDCGHAYETSVQYLSCPKCHGSNVVRDYKAEGSKASWHPTKTKRS